MKKIHICTVPCDSPFGKQAFIREGMFFIYLQVVFNLNIIKNIKFEYIEIILRLDKVFNYKQYEVKSCKYGTM